MAGFEWTPERDAELRTMRGKGMRNNDIAEAMGTTLSVVYGRVVALKLPRLPVCGGARVKRGFWNDERDKLLRQLWSESPQPTLRAIRAKFDFAVSEAAISHRAVSVLGLPRRTRPAELTRRLEAVRSPFAGETPRVAAETPKLRVVVAPDETPCPYVDPARPLDPETGKVACCGVMVNRRIRRDGTKPGQYCKDHEVRVRSCGGEGTRAGARILPATRAGVMGWL
jgi:hypothetical protein